MKDFNQKNSGKIVRCTKKFSILSDVNPLSRKSRIEKGTPVIISIYVSSLVSRIDRAEKFVDAYLNSGSQM